MATREQVAKPAPQKREPLVERPKAHKETEREAHAKATAESEELNDLLDRIDDELSKVDAEAFVKGFVQLGGE